MLADDYPLLELFWTMLSFFMWIAWIALLLHVLGEVFRSSDRGGFAKAMWTILVVALPFVGVFVDVIVRGTSMSQRRLENAQRRDDAFRAYVQDAASSSVSTDQLLLLADLRDRGALNSTEYEHEKRRALS